MTSSALSRLSAELKTQVTQQLEEQCKAFTQQIEQLSKKLAPQPPQPRWSRVDESPRRYEDEYEEVPLRRSWHTASYPTYRHPPQTDPLTMLQTFMQLCVPRNSTNTNS